MYGNRHFSIDFIGDNLTVFAPSNAAFAKLGQTVTDKITGNADMLKGK